MRNRSQIGICSKFPRRTMERVRSALIDHIRYRASAASVLGSIAVRQNRHLSHGLQVRGLERLTRDRIVVVVLSVDQEVVRAGTIAVYRAIETVADPAAVAVLDSRLCQNQRDGIQAIDWQFVNLCRRQVRTEVSGLGLQFLSR